MKTHADYLMDVVPDLQNRFVLDLGSGRGKFLVDLALRKIKSVGLELNQEYIKKSQVLAEEKKVLIHVDQGVGEKLIYPDQSFDFVNMAEVIEHVDSPKQVMSEVYRVLKSGGMVYVSVPNRFGLKDQHFNLYFINWMPRGLAEKVLSFLGRHKDYGGTIGFQRLSEMHYGTFASSVSLFTSCGFLADDMRVIKIKNRFSGVLRVLALTVYFLLRPWYFDSFHFLLKK